MDKETDSSMATSNLNPNPTAPVSQHSSSPDSAHSSMQVTVHRLNGRNYLEWSQSVKLAIDGRGKLGYLTGEATEPAEKDAGYRQWRSENSLVTAWLLNSMEPSIAKPHLFMKSAKEVWDSVRDTYSDLENFSQIFELKTRLWQSKQGNRDVTSYYNEMVAWWQELDLCHDDIWENKEDYRRQKKREENDRVFMLLAGINHNLDEVKGRILGRRPLPSIREVFSEIRQEESRRKIMTSHDTADPSPEPSALFMKGADSGNDKKKKPWCDFCKKFWHTRETCWKIHGKPPGGKSRPEKALQTVAEKTHEQQVNSGQPQLTTEQIEELLNLLHASKTNKATCSYVYDGNQSKPMSCLMCSHSTTTWIIDSGASDHMTSRSSFFRSYKPCAGNRKVRIADGSFAAIAGIGDVKLSDTLTLSKVLHVPNLSCNLISISKLTSTLNCSATFFSSHCEFQDPGSGRMIGSARECEGLYFLDEGTYSNKEAQRNSCLQIASTFNDDEIYLWHFRLGHANFHYLKHLFPALFRNKNPSSFQCEICALAKHHRSTYLPRVYTPSKPFALIHSDIWGPSRVSTCHGKRWFVTLIDDHTRLSWVYLLKEKSEVGNVFKTFFHMVQNQFDTNIQILRSDRGTEYFAQVLGKFCDEKGIVQQSSCIITPQQNGIAERKNRHLLEISRALLFSNNVPKYLWGEAVLHATYLINRMPSTILKFHTPIKTLQDLFPKSRLFTNMSLKIFGCTVFIRNPIRNTSKLDPKALKCVFVGIAPNQKGYKCFDPNSGKMFVTMDVKFFENIPYFNSNLQGEKEDKDSNIGRVSTNQFHNLRNIATKNRAELMNLDFLDLGSDLNKKIGQIGHIGEITVRENSNQNPSNIGNPSDNLPGISNGNNNINIENNSPKIDKSQKSTEGVCNLPHRGRLGQVYERKFPNRRLEDTTPRHYQESELSPDNETGKSPNPVSPSSLESSNHDLIPSLDIPIAIRKGKRSCVKYPMSQFVSNSKLSSSFATFTTNALNIQIPKTIQEALNVPEWKKAVHEEMRALEKNRTWRIEDLPKDTPTVGCKWVFTPKFNADGSLERHKARLVAKGFTQTYGIDYTETFAPVAKLNTVRILLSIAASLDWPLRQFDVKNAFLNGRLEEEVYMLPPPGFEHKFGAKVCRLEKALYGLKQSPRAWFERFTEVVKRQGYTQGQSDHTLFTRFSRNGKLAVLIVYVDDILFTGDDREEMEAMKIRLSTEFEMKDLGEMKYFLAMEVARSKLGIVVSQKKYIIDLLKDTGMSGCRPVDTPIDPNKKLGDIERGTPVDTQQYQRLVGRLIYLSHTRPDIAFAVSLVSQFMHCPYEEHLEAAYRILRYLKGCPGKGLLFKKGENRSIEAFTDADWAGSITNRRSTSGYCTYVWGNLVTWRSKKQNVVSRSSAEAEYRAMANGVCELLWIRRVLKELKLEFDVPMKLFCDNKAAITIAHNPVQHDRTKHVEVDRHFIKENLEEGVICIPFVKSEDQTADILTKGLFKPTFDVLVNKLGMFDIYSPT